MARPRILDTLKAVVVLAAATAIGFLLETLGLSQANIVIIYILGVLVATAVTVSHWYSVNASLTSVLLFNYTFTEPMFVLKVEDAGTQLTPLITLLATIFTSSFTVQMKEKAWLSQQDAYRSDVILDASQMPQKAVTPANTLACTAIQLNKLPKRDITCSEQNGAGLKPLLCFREYSSPATGRGPAPDTLKELTAAWKCFQEGEETGAATGLLPAAAYHLLPLQSSGAVYGVMGIHVGTTSPSDFESSLAVAIIAQRSIALEKEYIPRKREEEAATARAEQLRSNLLRSISHDLHTPLTSIFGDAGVLTSDGENLSAEHRSRIHRDIYDDSMWLIDLVENLLSITRIEGQGVHPHMKTESLEEVIDEAMRHTNRCHEYHTIRANQVNDYILADMDTRLIIQVITNLMDNAVKYAPEGSTIMVNSRQEGISAVIDVSSNGLGIPDESKEKIFEMFYTTGHKSENGKQDMGLGLSPCRAIPSTHKGTTEVLDNKPAGSIFRPTLPAKEASLHE